jgi:8-oxo-dGTP pyrophosphatase MutT (NUDIX family)
VDERLSTLRDRLGARSPRPLHPPASERAAVAVVLRDSGEGLEVLFIRRSEHPQDPWSGQMAFPGGRSEPGDRDLLRTAIRETLEETGLDLSGAELLGALDEVQARGRFRPMDLSIQPFVFALEGSQPMRPSEEVRSLHWIRLDALLSEGARGTFTYTHGDASAELPCLRTGDLLIWGLTYRMFLDLGTALRPGEARG